MNYDVEEFDNSSVSGQQIDRYHVFHREVMAERLPDDPPAPVGAAVSAIRDISPNTKTTGFAAAADGRWIAVALAIVPTGEEDQSLRIDLAVLPDFRRQ